MNFDEFQNNAHLITIQKEHPSLYGIKIHNNSTVDKNMPWEVCMCFKYNEHKIYQTLLMSSIDELSLRIKPHINSLFHIYEEMISKPDTITNISFLHSQLNYRYKYEKNVNLSWEYVRERVNNIDTRSSSFLNAFTMVSETEMIVS